MSDIIKKYLEITSCDQCPYFFTDNYGRKYCFQTGSKYTNKELRPLETVKFKRNCPLPNVNETKE